MQNRAMHQVVEKATIPLQLWIQSNRTSRPLVSLVLLIIAIGCVIVLSRDAPFNTDVLSTNTVQGEPERALSAPERALSAHGG